MIVCPGARVVTGQETGPIFGSLTTSPVISVLPALVTTKSYGTCEPGARSPGSGSLTCFTRFSWESGTSLETTTLRIRWTSVDEPVDEAKPNL